MDNSSFLDFLLSKYEQKDEKDARHERILKNTAAIIYAGLLTDFYCGMALVVLTYIIAGAETVVLPLSSVEIFSSSLIAIISPQIHC